MYPAGAVTQAYPFAMRAPEVFLGLVCTEPSQIWAVTATLLGWIKPGVLGAQDSPHWLINEPWCMAKIKRLFPHWIIPTPDEVTDEVLKAGVKAAQSFGVREDLTELQAILPFDEETQKVEMPQQLRDLLRFMFTIDPAKRPSASSVLASEEFQAFAKLVGV